MRLWPAIDGIASSAPPSMLTNCWVGDRPRAKRMSSNFTTLARLTPLRTETGHAGSRPQPSPPRQQQSESMPRRRIPQATRPSINGRILVYDPIGDTNAILLRAGITPQPLTRNADLASASLVIVGRKSFDADFLSLSETSGLENAVVNGLNLLVFEQTADEVLGLKLHEQSARRVFIASNDHRPTINRRAPRSMEPSNGTIAPDRMT